MICNMFESLQGEGIYAGTPALFIRTWGCNMNPPCSFCDEKLHSDESKMYEKEIEDLVDEIGNKYRHIVITGGEPMLQQKGIEELLFIIQRKQSARPIIQIETNGTIPLRQSLFTHKSRISIYNS